tara:strand:+ start:374 stop:727 length:354 start_codon:yes stop_codon:yes gene_type:complete
MALDQHIFSETAVGTDSGASATHAAEAVADTGSSSSVTVNRTHVVTSISGHTDADSIITIESPASTVVWQSKIDVSVEGTSFNFPGIAVEGVPGAAILGKIASSSSDCQVNISGTTR